MKKLSFFLALALITLWLLIFNSISISQWQTYQTPVQTRFSDVSVVNQNIIWASGGTVVKTTNAGQNWIVAGTGLPSVQFYHIAATDENNVWVTGEAFNGGQIFHTTNGGLNWTEQFYSQPFWINGIHFFNASTGIFLRDHSFAPAIDTVGFFITRNGGANWYRSANSPITTILTDMCMSAFDTNLVWFYDNNKFYRLSGGLDNPWQSVIIDSMIGYNASACFVNSSTGYLADDVGNNFRLWKSTNSGQNWSVISRDSTMSIYKLQCFENSNLFFVNGGLDIRVSTNSGLNWQYRVEYQYSDSISLAGMDGYDINSVWIAGNKGRLFRYNSAYIGLNQVSTLVPESFKLYQNYPNPFNPSTKIKFDLPNAGKIGFSVYDILGKEIYELSEYTTSGVYEIVFDASDYSSGVYYYSIEFGEFIQSKKMIMLK